MLYSYKSSEIFSTLHFQGCHPLLKIHRPYMRFRFLLLRLSSFLPLFLAQSSNDTLIYQLQEFLWDSTFVGDNDLNQLSVCPFVSGYSKDDEPYASLTQSLSDYNEGCILDLTTNPYNCFRIGEKKLPLSDLCNKSKYRFHMCANWIMNSVANGTIPAISKRPISFLIESINHGPVTVTYDLTIDTTTGSWFPMMGGFGGSYKKTVCDEGQYVNMIKAKHESNYYFYNIYIGCTDGKEMLASGTGSTNLVTVQNCASNYPINGVYTDLVSDWEAVWGMRFVCADKTNTVWRGGIDTTYKHYQMCPKGSLVTGLHVHSGAIIDGFALICEEVPFSVEYVPNDSENNPLAFKISDDSPFIYLNGSMFTGSLGYGGPLGIQMRFFIDYNGNENGTIEIYSSTRKVWSALKSLPVTLKDVTSNYVRVRLSTNMMDKSKLFLDVVATTLIGHSKSLPQQTLLIHVATKPPTTSKIAPSEPSSSNGIIIASIASGSALIFVGSVIIATRAYKKISNSKLHMLKMSNNTTGPSYLVKYQSPIVPASNIPAMINSNISNTNSTPYSIPFDVNRDGSLVADCNTVTINNTLTMSQGVGTSLSVPGYLKLDPDRDFAIDEKVGEGGTATVFKAKILNPKLISKHGLVNAAIKMVYDENPSSFMFEIAIMGSLPPSPYIVKFLGYFENPNGIAMKIYEGTLKDLLFHSDIPLSMSNIKQMARDIATGCKLIHSIGLIHFDIKPHNILVERIEMIDEVRCSISDFGCSKPIGTGLSERLVKGLQLPENMGLTVAYSSPELKGNMECLEDHKKIDVYAFGITLFEMMTRTRAWPQLKANELADKIIKGDRPIFSEHMINEASKDKTIQLLLEIASSSWNEIPEVRPQFESIVKRLNE